MKKSKFQVALNNVLGKNIYLYDIFIIKYNSIGIEETILSGRIIIENVMGTFPKPIKKLYFDKSMYNEENENEIAKSLYYEIKEDMQFFK